MITRLKYWRRLVMIWLIKIALWGVIMLQRWLFVWDMWRRIFAWKPSVKRNTWIFHQDIKIYVRLAMRYRMDTYITSLDLASVEVSPGVRRCRRFADTLLLLEGLARVRGYHRVTVENIFEPALAAALTRRGYRVDEGPTVPVCSMYKTITRVKISADNDNDGADRVRRFRGGR